MSAEPIDSYVPPTDTELRRSLLLEAAAYIEEGNGFSPTRAETLVPRLRKEAERVTHAGVFHSLDMTVDAWWETTCNDEEDLVAISLDTAGSQSTHQFRLTVNEATELRRMIDETLLAIRIGRDESFSMDEDLAALHAPALLKSARAVAKWFREDVYISRVEDGGDFVLTAEVPRTNLFLTVHPDGMTVLTDER